ncbi:SusD family protein [compost metagenome]
MLNNLDDAIEDLDVIRIRAGATADNTQAFQTVKFSSPSISKPDLIDAIYKERMLELFAELGHRWFDAKRSGKNLSDFFENRKPGIEESDAYYPIPAEEMQRNQKLKQNEGYF